MIKVVVISPVYDSYPAAWVQSVFSLIGSKMKVDEDNVSFSFISPAGSSNITSIRNACLQQMFINEKEMKNRFDYILFIDCDIIFKPQDIQKLLNHKKDAVSGLYFEKSPEYRPVVGFNGEHPLSTFMRKGFPRISKNLVEANKLVQVDWLGMGFVLLKRDIVDKIEYPWFEMEVVDLGTTLIDHIPELEIKKEILSEDITFWRKVSKLEYQIFVDTSIKLQHIGKRNYSANDYLAFHQQ